MPKVALITGASKGIGREFARIHAERGGDVVLIDIDKAGLIKLKNELESQFSVMVAIIEADLTQTGSPQDIYQKVKEWGIEIDYLINNAGFGSRGNFHEQELEKNIAMIQLNIISLTALTQLFLSEFIRKNKGKILNIASLAGLMPGPFMAVYYATKAYVFSFSNALTEELRHTDVSVTTLLPGATDTEFGKVAGIEQTPIFRSKGSARKVAEAGYAGMLAGKLNVLTGLTTVQKILTPLIPITPKIVLLKIIRRLHKLKV